MTDQAVTAAKPEWREWFDPAKLQIVLEEKRDGKWMEVSRYYSPGVAWHLFEPQTTKAR